MPSFADWTTGSNTKVSIADDVYQAIIGKVELTEEKDQDGITKRKVVMTFNLEGIADADGNAVSLNRKFGATFAMNPRNQNPSMLAKAVSALTGIPATQAAALQAIDPYSLMGKRCRVATRFNATSGYTNIENILPAARAAAPTPGQSPTARLAEMAEQATSGRRAARPSREPEPEVPPEESCVNCGGQLYEDDDDTCLACRTAEVPFE